MIDRTHNGAIVNGIQETTERVLNDQSWNNLTNKIN